MKILTFKRPFNFTLLTGLALMSLAVNAVQPAQPLSPPDREVEAGSSHFNFYNSQVTITVYNGIVYSSAGKKEVSSPTPLTVTSRKATNALIPLAAWSGQSGGDTFQVIFDGKVYQNAWWVESTQCPGEAAADPDNNPWRVQRDATTEEMETLGNPTSCDQGGEESLLLIQDPKTLETYELVGFKPDGSGTNLSYTSASVVKPMYNEYQSDSAKPKLSAYITDWCQYDGRLDGLTEPKDAGRGFDLLNIDPTAYDKLIFSFMGICGDQGGLTETISAHCQGANFQNGHITIVDSWGDLASYRNVGLDSGHPDITPDNFITYYKQSVAAGLLGGLRELQKKAPSLELAFSVGGWTMSGYFSEVAADPVLRQIFVESVVDFFTRFPMFSSVDIDWEYPGGGGLPGNGSSEDDGENYALLIGELRTALDKAFDQGKKQITIAASADVNKIDKSNIKGLIEAGLDNIFLMSYDFFGMGWAENLAHHTNLYPTNASPFSIETAVNYLINTLGVSSSIIHLGYANYGRSAAGANITSLDYEREGLALGSFEKGAPEFFDVLFNYLDLENGKAQGKNGFELMTDTVANADYLYSSGTNHFISFDTPRTGKAKGEYVITKGLAGAFSWSADQDDGLLANAAREGMGYQIIEEKFDMDTIYNDGRHFNLDLETKTTKSR